MKIPPIDQSRIVSSFFFKRLALLVCGATALVMANSTASASVIGYWRFEDGAFLSDSGGNGLTLSPSASAPTQAAIPESGRTSDFYNPIPQTGASNGSTASFVPTNGNFFSREDSTVFNVSSGFTIEAMVNTTTVATGNRMIASQWNNNRSWGFLLSGGTLQLQLSPEGTSTVIVSSGVTLSANVDYYLAASFDLSDQENGVKFYYQDLTNGGSLQTVSVGHSLSTLRNSSAAFGIGAINISTGGSAFWSGNIDEVRLSNTVLSQSDLLAVPEPATMALAGLGAAFCLAFLRKRKLG